MSGGAFVVSLDFELHWGVRDLWSVAQYRDNLLGVRTAVPALLALFREFDVHATWATVGFLLCEDRRELLDALPARRPAYRDPRLSPYGVLDQIGRDERDDPFHFAPSLVRRIADTPGQEIGTHTLSHFYCLEPGQSPADLRADLEAAAHLARVKTGRPLESIVFPRNQVSAPHLSVCADLGLRAYRGNPEHWAYRARAYDAESPVRRAFRLADAYLPLSRPHARPGDGTSATPVDVAASRYLRPWSGRRRAIEALRFRRIAGELADTAANGGTYHLWWHPHDFGVHLQENLAFLRGVLVTFARLRERYGMESLSMAEAARRRATDAAPARDVVTAHFDASASYWRDVYADADVQGAIYRERRARALALADGLALPPRTPVLEVGCGAGSAAVTLADRGYVVHAIDLSPTMLALARGHAAAANVGGRLHASLGDVRRLPFPDGSFRLVLALGVLPWLDDLDAALREIRRVLAPGGHAILSADNRWRLNALLDPRLFPPLGPVRRAVRRTVDGLRHRPPGARVHMHAAREIERLVATSGLVKVTGTTLGFGPFSLFGGSLASGARGIRLHRTLQRLADAGVPLLRATGAQYVVLVRRLADTERLASPRSAAVRAPRRVACP